MSVYVNNIVISAGASFSQELTLSGNDDSIVNLSGYGISSYIRKHPESSVKTAEFIVDIINPTQGTIQLSLDSTVTATIKEGRYVYDILSIKPDGKKSIIVEGNISARAGISS